MKRSRIALVGFDGISGLIYSDVNYPLLYHQISSGYKPELNSFYQTVRYRNKRMSGIVEYLNIIKCF